MHVLWGVTGGGAYLREIVDLMHGLKMRYNLKITTVLSRWGYEVSRIYGVLDKLKTISPGGYYEEFLVDMEAMYYIGRLNLGRYRLVVIAPATGNSVAKMIHGIADTPPTLAFAEALKSRIPVVVFPTDTPSSDGYVYSEAPCYIDHGLCRYSFECRSCSAMDTCPVKAIVDVGSGRVRIDLGKCIGCGECVSVCGYGAIRCWERIRIRPSPIDLSNIDALSRINGVYVARSLEDLEKLVKELGGLNGPCSRHRSWH